MAKSQTVRSTIKNDPFGTLIPDRVGEQAAEAEEAKEEVALNVPPNNVVTPIRHEQPQLSRAVPSSAEAIKAEGQKREKLTIHLSRDLAERVKNAAYWNPRLTIAGISEMGVRFAIEQIEKENGGAYPRRESELKGGRPIGS